MSKDLSIYALDATVAKAYDTLTQVTEDAYANAAVKWEEILSQPADNALFLLLPKDHHLYLQQEGLRGLSIRKLLMENDDIDVIHGHQLKS